jgi:hypothetical protein
VDKPRWRKPLGRPWFRWKDNIKINVTVRGWQAWTGLIWLRIGIDARFLWMR